MKRAGRGRNRKNGLRRLVGPALAGAALGLLVPFGCGVDHRPPALTASDTATSGAGLSSGNGGAGGQGGSGASSGEGAGPASACECAAVAFTGDGNACSACLKKASAADQDCASQGIDCGANAVCAPVVICLAACQKKPGPTCVSDCLYPPITDAAHQAYLAFLACACESCGSFCAAADPVTCTPMSYPDAGPGDASTDGAPGDAGAGGGGGGG